MANPPDDSPVTPAGAPPDAPPPGSPIRLDGAFPRTDLEHWRAAAEASLRGGATLDGVDRETLDGLAVDLLYHDSPIDGRLAPGDPLPASRPSTSEVSDEPCWDNRLHVLGDTSDALAAHALAGLAGGVTSLELDVRATRRDDQHARSLPLDALPRALDGVHVDMIGLSLRAGGDTDAALDALLSLLRERGHDPASARVELDADPLGELARHGRGGGDLADARARLVATAARAASELPVARVVAVDTVVHHAAGASARQELVAGIAAATDYVDALLDAGLEPQTACRTLVFRVALDADIVGGVVKLRALERLWNHALGSAGLPVVRPHVIVETSHRHLSSLAPWVNHLRNVAACTAAAIGGADTVIVHPHDRVDGRRVGADAVTADRVARNLPILLAEEGGLLAVDDAAGGAHAIESLTRATVESAWSALGELQEGGGLAAALASGRWRESVARTHAARVARLADGESVRVGVNRFRHDGAERNASALNDRAASHGERAEPPVGSETDVTPLLPVREASAFEGDPVPDETNAGASA